MTGVTTIAQLSHQVWRETLIIELSIVIGTLINILIHIGRK